MANDRLERLIAKLELIPYLCDDLKREAEIALRHAVKLKKDVAGIISRVSSHHPYCENCYNRVDNICMLYGDLIPMDATHIDCEGKVSLDDSD